ncbi:helix-turn-helix transcriptional regulator [Conexibacter woesei]|uniref:Transcriptional regulator, LuxR family n=1 Tax=Conexibacter woesei (strain DSM 14684 / CCUG 47730 / CIP 108061 / JCM 11494 / NBRC 100937 / ID131577) TaxID=469383 RepID=D3F8R5_CONWI|nr:LuxR family transcriptional regulator [Conexibacter woesei]ADB51029.1 transcriptional regulator, LuxR family [Conexibacter woesei DSM 14684]
MGAGTDDRLPPLIGRARELRTLADALDALASDGAGSALPVTGEPGIGKTRLLDELHARALERGAIVLRGRAAPAHGDLPYDVFAEALRELHTASAPSAGDPLAHDRGIALTALTGAVPEQRSGGDERHAIWRGVRSLLEQAAARAPVVLILDDVHWADRASAGLLAYLLRRPPAAAVLLAPAWRDAHDRALTLELVEAARASRTRRIQPQHLTAEETALLIGSHLDAATLRAVVAESGGNPFYAEQLGRQHAPGAALGLTGARAHPAAIPADAGVPQSVVAAVHAELDALPPAAGLLARGAAIAGDPFELQPALAAAGIDPQAAEAALDALAAAAIVAPVPGDPLRFSFRHPIVWRALHDTTPAGWRIAAHARAATALATAGAPNRLRAHHIARSAALGDLDAVEALRDAAVAVLPQSPASAAEWAAAARGLLPEDVPEQVELLELEARAQLASGQLEAAHAAAGAALELASANDARRSGLLQQVVYLEMLLGWFDQARARLATAYEPGPDGAALRVFLAATLLVLIDPEAAIAVSELPSPPGVPDDPETRASRAAVLAVAAIARQALGDVEAALRDCDEACALLDAVDPDTADLWGEAALLLTLAERTLERDEQAMARLRSLLRARRPMRLIHLQLRAATDLALTLAERGELAEAAPLAESAVELGRMVNSRWLLANAIAAQVAVARLSGDMPRALAAAREALEQPLDRSRAYPGQQRRTLGATYLAAGDADACVGLFQRLGAVGAADLAPGGRVLVYELLTEAELVRGDVGAARAAVAQARAHAAERGGMTLTRMRALRAEARLRLAEDDAAGAAALALESAELAADAGAELEAARARLLAGQALVAAGRREQAIEALTVAEECFARRGIGLLRPHAVRELRGLGRRVAAPAVGTGVPSLSEREREIAALVAAGGTNREIAAALVVSPRTVETHVRNLVRKLGVADRTEVAAAIGAGSPGTGAPADERTSASRSQGPRG